MAEISALIENESWFDDAEREYLQIMTFMVGGELYGLNILKVQEIRSLCPLTLIPNSEYCILGMMNLRGAIVPVVDVRRKLAMPCNNAANDTRVIVIVKIAAQDGAYKTIGMVVDSVREASSVAVNELQKTPPDYRLRLPEDAIEGLINLNGHMAIILNPDSVFKDDFK